MNVDKTASIYKKVSIWIIAGLTLLGLMVMQLTGNDALLTPMLLSVGYSIICGVAFIQAWKTVATRSPATLPKFYLAGSAFRLMAAAIVLLIYCVAMRDNTSAIKHFAVVFILYYLVILIFDAIFFANVSKNSNI